MTAPAWSGRWSLFPGGARDNRPQARAGDLATFIADLAPVTPRPADKISCPAWSPCAWPEGARRSARAALEVSALVLDLDQVDAAELDGLLDRLKGRLVLAHLTWSADTMPEGKVSARVILPLSRPVPAKQWRGIWEAARAELGGVGDPQCSDPSRLYFLPADPAELEVVEGALFEPPAPRGRGRPASPVAATVPAILASRVKGLMRTWRTSQSEAKSTLGARLDLLLRGELFALQGERDVATWQLARALALALPEVEAEQLADLFRPSLAKMGADAPNDVADKITRARLGDAGELSGPSPLAPAPLEAGIALELKRERGYSQDEINFAAKALGVPPELISRRLIFYLAKSYWMLRMDPQIGARLSETMVDSDAAIRVYLELAPAEAAGLCSLRSVRRTGTVVKVPLAELAERHGVKATDVIADITADESTWDEERRIVIEAPCPMKQNLVPEESDDVAEWLHALGGDKIEMLLDWIAVCPRVERPSGMLVLTGPRGAGKSILGKGLARLWGDGWGDMQSAFEESFNEDMLKTPLLVSDEVGPHRRDGSFPAAEIRDLCQGRERTIKRKYKSSVRTRGCWRLMVLGNDINVIRMDELLGPDAIEASAERIRHIEVGGEAKTVLERLGPDARARMVEGGGIARHALYLAISRRVSLEYRFGGVPDRDVHLRLVVGEGITSAVCHWLVQYLLEPHKGDAGCDGNVRRQGGRVLVSPRALLEHFDMYRTNFRPEPTAEVIRKAFSVVAPDVDPSTGFHIARMDYLEAWTRANSYGTVEQLHTSLEQDSDIRTAIGVN